MQPEEVRRLRQRLGLTQKQFAAKCGVQVLTVNRWERGEQPPSGASALYLETLAAVEASPLGQFMGGREDKDNE